ncbi:MAG: hypothetical protein K6G16_09870 [Lachnospiraceae bacterium]|nr:hypothetical protein [Lachnospiraceae bacterium]
MDSFYKDYLFQKHILVSSGKPSDFPLETLFSLASVLNVHIVKGEELLWDGCVDEVAARLGKDVTEPFYRGFPETPRQLPEFLLLMDQLAHYSITYGAGDFSEAGHSLFEEVFERTAFHEETEPLDLSVVTDREAREILAGSVNDLLASTRPLSRQQYRLVLRFFYDYRPEITAIASKDTCVRLLIDTRDLRFADQLALSDVIRLVELLNQLKYQKPHINRLNLRNSDRKFLSLLIDRLIENSRDLRTCCEKKKIWAGLLHHIHYVPKTDRGREFVIAMRGRKNRSVYAGFEREMAAGNIAEAVRVLREGKGAAAVLRRLNYIVSRCSSPEDLEAALACTDTDNAVVLIQLMLNYGYPTPELTRTFQFTKFNRLRIHYETPKEVSGRKSRISVGQAAMLQKRVREQLEIVLRGRLGKVYIEPGMERYALPLQETVTHGGLGVLPTGSHIPINTETDEDETGDRERPAEGKPAADGNKADEDSSLREKIRSIFARGSDNRARKKVRAFIYWEKVNDIDLSMIGINRDGSEEEFSWRTMYRNQSGAITFSGDQTSGYYGGSEYFDIDAVKVRKKHPELRYLVFCANVFTDGTTFHDCICRTGYMMRDVRDSGQVYEPCTVRSAFTVDTESRFAYLFGIDLDQEELVWLNIARDSWQSIAGEEQAAFLAPYFSLTDIINMRSFFEMAAAEQAESAEEAQIIVTDREIEAPEGVEVIHPYDVERMMAIMNGKTGIDSGRKDN